MTRHARQLRELKQQQYAATIEAIHIESQSMQVVIAHFRDGNDAAAVTEFQRYEGTDEFVGKTASVGLMADANVLAEMSALVNSRKQVLDDLNELAKAADEMPELDPGTVSSAQAALENYLVAQADVVVAMRLDLGLPGDMAERP